MYIETQSSLEQQISQNLKIPVLVSRLLLEKGLDSSESSLKYLYPTYSDISTTFNVFPKMEKTVQLVKDAIKNDQKICIFGDYDVDGITSTVILLETLKVLKANHVTYYIPHRFKEGYGLNVEAVTKICQDTDLLITVDCGITSLEPIQKAKELDTKVIIIDHHHALTELPNADAIIVPPARLQTDFAAAGLCFKVAQALLEKDPNKKYEINRLLDLAALGTVIDIAPLVNENRTISFLGLQELNKLERPGLRSLCNVAKREPPFYGKDLGFILGPRLNAAGRMAHANLAIDLLLAKDEEEAYPIAVQLEELNNSRRALTEKLLKKAEKQIHQKHTAIVVSLADCEEEALGVIGLVAGKLCEKYRKLAIALVETDQGLLKGSGRSIETVNLLDSLHFCKQFLHSYGGHPLAAGLSLEKENLEVFRDKIIGYCSLFNDENLLNKSTKDLLVPIQLSELSFDLISELKQLEPFGSKNILPLWQSQVSFSTAPRAIGKKKEHLLLNVTDGKNRFRAIGWRMVTQDLLKDLNEHRQDRTITFEAVLNEYQGKTDLELRLRSIS